MQKIVAFMEPEEARLAREAREIQQAEEQQVEIVQVELDALLQKALDAPNDTQAYMILLEYESKHPHMSEKVKELREKVKNHYKGKL